MNCFAKKKEQKRSIGTPPELLIIIYTDKSHRERITKKPVNEVIKSAMLSGRMQWRSDESILPPSSVSSGKRLKMVRHRDIAQKGAMNRTTAGLSESFTEIPTVSKYPMKPARGPPSASKNSSEYDICPSAFIRAPSRDRVKVLIFIFKILANIRCPVSCISTASAIGARYGVFNMIRAESHIINEGVIFSCGIYPPLQTLAYRYFMMSAAF